MERRKIIIAHKEALNKAISYTQNSIIAKLKRCYNELNKSEELTKLYVCNQNRIFSIDKLARQNLTEVGREVGLELEFDKDNMCALETDNGLLFIRAYISTQRLVIFTPLFDDFPESRELKLKLYQTLLEGAMLGEQMAGGSVGIDSESKLCLMHASLDLSQVSPDSLKLFLPKFIDCMKTWRDKCRGICNNTPQKSELPSASVGNNPSFLFAQPTGRRADADTTIPASMASQLPHP